MHNKIIRIGFIALTTLLVYLAGSPVFAHSGETHKEKEAENTVNYSNAEEHAFGKAADPDQATHTIRITMSDRMRFEPDSVEVNAGDIVRFEIHNGGQLLHEMVLGTTDDLNTHAALMKKFPGMEHEEPHMAHVAPGKDGVIGWHFKNAGEFFYGCLIPGHFDAGMIGKVIVR